MKVTRPYYECRDAAKILDCEPEDLFYLAFKKEIKLGNTFHEKGKEYEFTCRFYVTSQSEYEDWLMCAELGSYNDRRLNGSSCIQVIGQDLKKDDEGLYFTGWMKGYWNCDYEYIVAYYEQNFYPEDWASYFYPDNLGGSCFVIKAVPNYEDVNDNYCYQEELYITGSALFELKEKITTKESPKDNLQSNVQKERHAVPRVEILMALVSLYHQGLNIRKENATQLTELLWKRSSEFWPGRNEPPLKFDTVRDIISEALKGPVFNN